MDYELSLTRNYVTNWTIFEAIREIIQNAIDSDGEMFITYKDEKLSVGNKNTNISAECLLLGHGTKRDDDEKIGKYGEGLPLALLVLTRDGINVTVKNKKETWVPSIKKSKSFQEDTLHVFVKKYENLKNKDLIFEISPVSQEIYEELVKKFPCITGDYGEIVECATGDILLEPKFKGKMFVEGLYVQSDSSFKYGYNFKSSIVELDRDRKAINYHELKMLTAESLVTAKECHPKIFEAISKSYTDSTDIIKVIDKADAKFVKEYADMYYEENHLDKSTLVATEGTAKQIRKKYPNISVVKGTEIESFLIAKANEQLDVVQEAKKERDREDDLKYAAESFIDTLFARVWRIIATNKKDIPTWLYDALKSALDEEGWVDGLSTLEEKLGVAFYEDEEFDWNLETLLKMINKKED